MFLATCSRWCESSELASIPQSRNQAVRSISCTFGQRAAPEIASGAIFVPRTWQERQDSNPRPSVLETDALPTELRSCDFAARAGPCRPRRWYSGVSSRGDTSKILVRARSSGQIGGPRQPVSRVLYPPEADGGHLSRPAVADGLERPTRGWSGNRGPPIRPCSGWGLPGP